MYALAQRTTLYKEQVEVLEKVEQTLTDLIWEEETGLPAIARMFPPADGYGMPL